MNNRICIATLGDISQATGPARVLAFANGLIKNGFKVHLVIPKPRGQIPISEDAVTHHVSLPTKNGIVSKFIQGLLVARKAKDIYKRYDTMVQFMLPSLAGIGRLVGFSQYILDMSDIGFDSPVFSGMAFSVCIRRVIKYFEKLGASQASYIIVVSEKMKQFLIDQWGIKDSKIVKIPNGYFNSKLDINEFSSDKSLDVVFLGSLVRSSIDIDKFIFIAKKLQNFDIHLIGDGPLRKNIETCLQRRGLTNIHLHGELPYNQAIKMASRAKVGIYPVKKTLTTELSCPVKLFDYAIAEVGIVADNVPEICEIFAKKNAALTCNPGNKKEFASKVRHLLENDSKRIRIAENARKLVESKFTRESQGNNLAKCYKEWL